MMKKIYNLVSGRLLLYRSVQMLFYLPLYTVANLVTFKFSFFLIDYYQDIKLDCLKRKQHGMKKNLSVLL